MITLLIYKTNIRLKISKIFFSLVLGCNRQTYILGYFLKFKIKNFFSLVLGCNRQTYILGYFLKNKIKNFFSLVLGYVSIYKKLKLIGKNYDK